MAANADRDANTLWKFIKLKQILIVQVFLFWILDMHLQIYVITVINFYFQNSTLDPFVVKLLHFNNCQKFIASLELKVIIEFQLVYELSAQKQSVKSY